MLTRYFPRKSRSYRQALHYVLREQVNAKVIAKHNLRGETIEHMIQEFQANENRRRKQSRRKDSVKLRHIVLSWNERDSVTLTAMTDMTKHFMWQYSPHAVYLAVAHEPDDDHPHAHVHIIMGGTDMFGKSLNLSNADDLKLKQATEAYQRQHYPEYTHSQVEHGQRSNSPTRQPEYWLQKRGQKLYKDELKQKLREIMSMADSWPELIEKIRSQGLVPWYDRRTGKVVGITYQGKNHRFRTIGVDRQKLLSIKRDRIYHSQTN